MSETELFASPQDAQDRADALLDSWNALIHQAVGPSSRGRQDIPPLLRKQIISDRARFKTFITSPTFGMGGALLPQEWADSALLATDYATLQKWYAKYDLRARQVAAALPASESLAPEAQPRELPRKTTPVENLELASNLARNVAIGVGAIAASALLLSLLWKRSK